MTAILVASGSPSDHLLASLQLPLTGADHRVKPSAGLSATTSRISTVVEFPFAAAARSVNRCSPAASCNGLNSSSRVATPLVEVFVNVRDLTLTKSGGGLVGE